MKTVSLGELRRLNGFVRCQEIPTTLQSLEREHGILRRYPLFDGWSEPDREIDIFDGRYWRRVRFLKKENDQIVWEDDEGTGLLAMNPYVVAPAGYFTDFDAPEVDLSDVKISYNAEIPGKAAIIHDWVTHSSKLLHVHWPYVTLLLKFIPPDAKVATRNIQTPFTFHVADPRLTGNTGVSKPPPQFNSPIAVSHRWLDAPHHPDLSGHQFDELLARAEEMRLHEYQPFLLDYCALPQKPRTEPEDEQFERQLNAFHRVFKSGSSMIIRKGAKDYQRRGWCMLELMLIALSESLADHPEELTGTPKLPPGVDEAWQKMWQKTTNYVRLRKAWMTRSAEFYNKGKDFYGDDPSNENAAFYHTAQKQREEIIRSFEEEYELEDETDRPPHRSHPEGAGFLKK